MTSRLARSVAFAVSLALLAPLGSVRAQGDLDLYRELFAEGSRLWANGQFTDALEQFEQAHQVFPNARSHRALGLVLFELRDYVRAVQNLRRALRDDRRPLTDRLRVDPERVLEEARGFVGQYQVVTTTHAFLEVDGTPLNLVRLVVLTPGEHTLRISASGFHSEERQLVVEGGENDTLSIPLRPIRTGGDTETDPDPDGNGSEAASSSPARPAGIALLATAGAATLGGVAAHMLYRNARDAHRSSVDMGGCLPLQNGNVPEGETRSDCRGFEDRWERSRPWIFVGYGVGAAMLVAGIVLVTRPATDSRSALVCSTHADLGVSCTRSF